MIAAYLKQPEPFDEFEIFEDLISISNGFYLIFDDCNSLVKYYVNDSIDIPDLDQIKSYESFSEYEIEVDLQALSNIYPGYSAFGDFYSFTTVENQTLYFRKKEKLIRRNDYRMIYLENITDEIKLNCRYHALISNAMNPVIITDEQGKIEWVNEAFEKLTEYNISEVVGRKPGKLLQGPDSSPYAKQLMRNAIRRKEKVRVEVLNYSKTGKKYWLDIEITPNFDLTNNFIGFSAIQYDITETISYREKIERDNRKLQKEVSLEKQMMRELNHRVKNNLNFIHNTLQLKSLNFEGSVIDFAQEIDHRVISLAKMHDSLANMDSENLTVKDYIINLTSNLLNVTINERRTKPNLLIDINHFQLNSEKLILIGLLINELITNSFKHAFPLPKNTDKVSIVIHKKEDKIYLNYGDNGVGIKGEQKQNSIGMIMIKSFAKQLGGTFQIQDQKGFSGELVFDQ